MAMIQCTWCAPDGTMGAVGTGRVTCFICDGAKQYDDAPPPPSPAYEKVMNAIATWRLEWDEHDTRKAVLESLT